ncbi:MAG: glycoside hydrolase, partial [Planctomycetota bacterium]
HESIQSFIVWGFWEGRHWRPESAFYDMDWNLKPTGEAWRDLVLDEWWTRETVTTDASGNATVRGFLGDYEIRVGETTVVTALPKDGRAVRVEAR